MATVGTVWESAADTWTSHAVIATADIGCLWCDWIHIEFDKGLDMVDKASVGDKKWSSQKWLSNETNKQTNKWCHNERDGVPNHRRLDCLRMRLFRLRSKKTSKLRVTGLCGIHRWPVNSPHKGSVTRKMFPFDDIFVSHCCRTCLSSVKQWKKTILFWFSDPRMQEK